MGTIIYYDSIEDYERQVKKVKLYDKKNKEVKELKKQIEELNKKINEYEEREEMQYLIKDEERFNYSMSDQVDY